MNAGEGDTPPLSKVPVSSIQGTPFSPAEAFIGSPFEEIGLSGLFDAHSAETSRIAVLPNGDDSFAARIQALEKADTSVRIQALVFTGDESGLYIADLLKAKKALGIDVRVIVDAMSKPWPANAGDVFRSETKRHRSRRLRNLLSPMAQRGSP